MMNKEMKARIIAAIRQTWGAIEGDWWEISTQHGDGECSLEGAIEGCIDADRTATFGGDAGAAIELYSLTWPEMKELGAEALKDYF